MIATEYCIKNFGYWSPIKSLRILQVLLSNHCVENTTAVQLPDNSLATPLPATIQSAA